MFVCCFCLFCFCLFNNLPLFNAWSKNTNFCMTFQARAPLHSLACFVMTFTNFWVQPAIRRPHILFPPHPSPFQFFSPIVPLLIPPSLILMERNCPPILHRNRTTAQLTHNLFCFLAYFLSLSHTR